MDANEDNTKTFTFYWKQGITTTINSDKVHNAIAKTLITDDQLKGITVTLDFYEESDNSGSWRWNPDYYRWERAAS